MLLKEENQEYGLVDSLRKYNGIWITIGLLVLLSLYWYSSTSNLKTGEAILCNAENVEGKFFVNDAGHQFSHGEMQSSEEAFSGKYSCKIGKGKTYGISFILENPIPGQFYKASVWQYRPKKVTCLLYTSPSPRDLSTSRMPSSA